MYKTRGTDIDPQVLRLVLTGRPATPLYYIYTQIDPDFSQIFLIYEKYFHNVEKA